MNKKLMAQSQKKLNDSLMELGDYLRMSFRKYIFDWDFRVEENLPYIAGVKKPKYGQKKVQIMFNCMEVKNIDKKQLNGVILHEILHVYNNHFARLESNIKDISIFIPSLGYSPSLWNIATDLAINESILNEFDLNIVDLPKMCLLPKLFPPEIARRISKQPSEKIFHILKEKYEKNTEKFGKMIESLVRDMIKNGFKPQNKNGNDFKGLPMPININFDGHENLDKVDVSNKIAQKIEKNFKSDEGEDESNAKSSSTPGSNWDVSKEKPLDYIIKNMAVNYYISLKMSKILKSIRSKITSSISSLAPKTFFSYKKLNRKKRCLSKKYHAIYKGKTKITKNKDLIVALDTSGSVSDQDIETALRVVNKFILDWKFNIFFIQSDNEIRDAKYILRPIKSIDVKGRGGTNYQVIFDYVKKTWVDKMGVNLKQITIVFIGDGETSYNLNNYGLNTIWLFNKNHHPEFYQKVKFGQKFVIPE